jgi:hypothetical protein
MHDLVLYQADAIMEILHSRGGGFTTEHDIIINV